VSYREHVAFKLWEGEVSTLKLSIIFV